MSNRTSDLNYADALPGLWPYQLTNALTVYKGSLLALSPSTGYAVKWADTAGLLWRGIAVGGQVGDTSATPPVEVTIDERGVTLKRIAVTGASAITDVTKLVWCSTDNPADLSLTPTVNVGAVGEITRWYASTTCDVRLFTPAQYAARAGNVGYWEFPILCATIADGDLMTGFTPGFAGRIVGLQAVVTAAVTTGSKASTLNLEIGTTNLTGGSLALTSANLTPLGAIVSSTAITAANHFTSTDTISLEAASTTAFVEGSIMVRIKYVAD